jgi:hypothetical protein
MSKISELTTESLVSLQELVIRDIEGATCLEEAAQTYMGVLFRELGDSIILARFFATIPLERLPEMNRTFVTELCRSKGIENLLSASTPTLSLLGTHGVNEAWHDRRASAGHVGIPLVSADFIEAIPMMSRLLKQMGLGLEWIDSNDTELVVKTVGKMGGIFHVSDAATELDARGRKIIAAQDFVEEYGVKSVFGIGGGYLGTDMFFTTIIFTNEVLDREILQRFMIQANLFKTATMSLVLDGLVFDERGDGSEP